MWTASAPRSPRRPRTSGGGDESAPGDPADRFPRRVYAHGDDPDPRFSLANERTFLAWVRTALALFAAGVALEAVSIPVDGWFRPAAAGIFVLLGLVAVVYAWSSWMRTERSLRERRPLRGPAIGPVLMTGIAAAVLLLVIGFVV
ncbi:DUF202 domain-containing protein [Glycomyces sp. A-F 0318]|uniref:YidH family protein n=1 Tax=Glycomyces amatae TaxID=2881355 RepID=UPI001E372556|nr:DUF202 domain-containing protein [Glycomyces amatae]MCD0447309.1 DUF202 domain-containing protein [Glycomyces amatae]